MKGNTVFPLRVAMGAALSTLKKEWRDWRDWNAQPKSDEKPPTAHQFRRHILMSLLGAVGWAGVSEFLINHVIKPPAHVNRERVQTYLMSTGNAAMLAVFSLYKLAPALIRKHTDASAFWQIPTQGNQAMMVLALGYFLSDFWVTREDWIKYWANSIHHFLAIGTAILAFTLPRIQKFIPHVVIIEVSTVILNAAWFAKEWGGAASRASQHLSKAFALAFFLSRVVWFPYFLVLLRKDPVQWAYLGWLKHILVGLTGLQFYWFALIARKLLALGKVVVKKDVRAIQ